MSLNSQVKKEQMVFKSMLINWFTDSAFSFLRFVDMAPSEASYLFRATLVEKWMYHLARRVHHARRRLYSDEPQSVCNTSGLFLIKEIVDPLSSVMVTPDSIIDEITHVSEKFIYDTHVYGQCYLPAVSI